MRDLYFSLLLILILILIVLPQSPSAAQTKTLSLPIIVPISGPLALEGTSQRNGALLAFDDLAASSTNPAIITDVFDSAGRPEKAVTALHRALRHRGVVAVIASIFGPDMLAMIPVAEKAKVPLITVSGTDQITGRSRYVFRFFPADPVVKEAQARYAVQNLAARRMALLYQTTAYGQSGRTYLKQAVRNLGAEIIYEEGLSLALKDMGGVMAKVVKAQPDLLLLHLHSTPSILVLRERYRQRTQQGLMKVVAGSALHQPAVAALLPPPALAHVCAETSASPVSAMDGTDLASFRTRYRARFNIEPDAFALAQYNGMAMALTAVQSGVDSPKAMREYLAHQSYQGIESTYVSDGKGNMSRDSLIVCYDGSSRTPRIRHRFIDQHSP